MDSSSNERSFLSHRQEPTGAETSDRTTPANSTPLKTSVTSATKIKTPCPLVRIEPVSDAEEVDDTVTSHEDTMTSSNGASAAASAGDVVVTLQCDDVKKTSGLPGTIV